MAPWKGWERGSIGAEPGVGGVDRAGTSHGHMCKPCGIFRPWLDVGGMGEHRRGVTPERPGEVGRVPLLFVWGMGSPQHSNSQCGGGAGPGWKQETVRQINKRIFVLFIAGVPVPKLFFQRMN